ncbi:hypothetical protein F511_09875 [Dorcoceras hygrometricum]|uniref:NOT2/NOT3/NOT5 C-terminal domain-containing protein n=1 Tax=Dorcoceras hygrometricum TaxID=472368 RepID=A0A2Z7CXV1_9LAMI|nr:hypothetical protein F511_09875 [Dorcoceras hygrometricum]
MLGSPLIPEKGYAGHGLFCADDSRFGSTRLANDHHARSCQVGAGMPFSHNLFGNSHVGYSLPYSQNQFQDEDGRFSYMGLLSDSYDDYDANVGDNDLCHQSGYHLVGNLQGSLNIGGVIDHSSTQRQKENLVQSPQYPQYQHFNRSQPRFYNPSRGKETISAQGSQLGPDDFGLLGLMKTIKGVNLATTSLAIGVDPHSLGLDLNSSEPLHQKFTSPWSDQPLKEGPKYDIPNCYNSKQPPALKRSHFTKFHLAMLLYIFYSMPQDQAQLFAADELHDREWYYHRELRMWFTRDKGSVPAIKNAEYEVGSYILFDPDLWQTIKQENVFLYYDMIERRPTIPR